VLQSGWPQLSTTKADHDGAHPKDAYTGAGKAFNTKGTTLPQRLRDDLVNTVSKATSLSMKRAGTLSNQRAVAATGWLIHNARSLFQAASMAWTGVSISCEFWLNKTIKSVIDLFHHHNGFF